MTCVVTVTWPAELQQLYKGETHQIELSARPREDSRRTCRGNRTNHSDFSAKKSAKACAVSVVRVGDDDLLRNNREFKQCHRSLEFPAQLISLVIQYCFSLEANSVRFSCNAVDQAKQSVARRDRW